MNVGDVNSLIFLFTEEIITFTHCIILFSTINALEKINTYIMNIHVVNSFILLFTE